MKNNEIIGQQTTYKITP